MNPKWEHKEGDLYSVVTCQYVGNARDGFVPDYRLQVGPFKSRETAWRHGMSDLGHDDFNLAVVRDGLLVAMLWNDELVDDDKDVLADVSTQTRVDWND